MADWSDLSAPYSDAIARIFPIHRAVVFLGGFSASLSIEKSKDSIASAFFSFKLVDVTGISTGFLKDSTGFNLIAALVAVLVAILISKGLVYVIFKIVNKSTNINNRIQAIDKNWANSLSIDDRKTALEIIDAATSDARNKLRTMAGFNELVAGFFAITLAASLCTGIVDFLTSLLLVVVSIISHAMSFYVFLDEYYGLAATKAQLLGKSLPKIEVNNS